jgi:hypothetical protein
VHGNKVRIHGKILHALSSVPFSRIRQAFSSDIKELYLEYSDNDLDRNLSIVSQLPYLEELVIDGGVYNLEKLAELENLRVLDIRNYSSSDCPNFSTMRSLESLTSLKFSSGDLWPIFSELKSFPNLESLSILSSGSVDLDYRIVDSISGIKQLKYMHIAVLGRNSFWPDLASLGRMNYLKTLEISSDSDFDGIHGFDELRQLEKLIINSVSRIHISQEFLSQIEIFCSNCLVEINEGWDEAQW